MIIKNLKSKGYVTITVLILMMVLVGIVYLFGDAVFAELAIARNNKGAQMAFSLAEAGVQEAIYRVQHDTTARQYFLAGQPDTSFSHSPALINNGSYDVTIDNTAPGVATVTSIGTYTMGLRTARREIKLDIAQATQPPEYPYDGAIYASGSGAGSSIADIDFWSAIVKIYGGSILSNRDINLKFAANVDVEKSVEAGDDVAKSPSSSLDCNCLFSDDDPENPPPACSTNPGCTPLEGAPAKTMPQVDFEAYKTIAKNTSGPSPDGNQYFADGDDFEDLIPFLGSMTFNGVIYVDDGIDLLGQILNMNGVLAASESIKLHAAAQINIAPPPGGGASGVLTQKNFEIMPTNRVNGTGLIYTGDRFEHYTMTHTTNLTGGIISRRTWFWGSQTTNIYFDANVINTALANPTDTPVIEINHWEEEY